MQVHIIEAKPRLLVGMHLDMSYTNNRTSELWRSFMPRRKECGHAINTDLFSVQMYKRDHDLMQFSAHTVFTKWAAVEVSVANDVPEGMQCVTIPGGLYAVFAYKGLSTDTSVFQYIFSQWLPQSEYVLDHRPHFEILGQKYKNNDVESEEEIWVPIRRRD